MINLGKKVVVLILLVVLIVPSSVFSRSMEYSGERSVGRPTGGAMAVDGLVIRPLGIGATAIGGIVFVLTLPFSALSGNVDQAKKSLVQEPARFTFKRSLGEFVR